MKSLSLTLATMAACCAVVGTASLARAVDADSVATKELELKQKELELEKAKVDAARAEQLAVEKSKLEIAEKKLELEKARQELAVQETATQLQMQLSGDVLFDTNEATLRPEAREKLRQVGVILAAYPQGGVTIAGYADSRGSADTNADLSRKRAEAVKTWLMNQSGIKEQRLAVKARGEESPVASNETAAGRAQNRRVEITVSKSGL